MSNRSSFRRIQVRTTKRGNGRLLGTLSGILLWGLSGVAEAGGVPEWMQAQLNSPLPPHDDKASAVQLYGDTAVTLDRSGKLQRTERRVYRILRPDGASYGKAKAYSDAFTHINDMRGWSLPPDGKPFEVKNRYAVEAALSIVNGELLSDLRVRILTIPAAVPGSLVGYEIQSEEQPLIMADEWSYQETVPSVEANYTLELPPGWQYKAVWINHAEQAPAVLDARRQQWRVSDLKPMRVEGMMPPWRAMTGRLFVSFIPPDGGSRGPQDWNEMGKWYLALTKSRREASPQISQKIGELTAGGSSLAQTQALASFVQSHIRYVAIELGIGGWQPHAAAEVMAHGYGDCKDKATLLITMLKGIGIEAHYFIVNTERGAIAPATPANLGFDHVIVAIQLPANASDPSLQSVINHPRLGRLLFFDPTDPYTAFGSLAGPLQAGYGLLVSPDGGELVQLPRAPSDSNSIRRTARMTLDETGTLRGHVHESLIGDPATGERESIANAQNPDHVKAIEARLGNDFAKLQIAEATVTNTRAYDKPLEWDYELEATYYAKPSGDLLIVRPRVLGSKSDGVMEAHEPRQHPIEFDSAQHDTDDFEIELPPNYVVDELPPPVSIEYDFASYHSTTELVGHTLHYRRSFEIRDLSLPVGRARDLREFYRGIAGDEHAAAVVRRARS